MKKKRFAPGACIATVLAFTPSILLADSSVPVSISEAPRVTQTVNSSDVLALSKTHVSIVASAKVTSTPSDAFVMNHMQLVLSPSTSRKEALEQLISDQHSPKSSRFQKWLTPKDFGNSFGVADSDIGAVKSWLLSQGFTINNVYPNKIQIDFSGTVGQVRQAFHTQENIYTIQAIRHLANASDISVPTALRSVITGVMGLNDFNAKALVQKPQIAQWDAAKHGFKLKTAPKGRVNGIGQAIGFGAGARVLVPNDLATMYGVRQLRANGVTGAGVTIAVVDDDNMAPDDWTNFVSVFNLAQYHGTFSQLHPQPDAIDSGNNANNCQDPEIAYGNADDFDETLLDAEWATAIAPGANIVVATCADYTVDGQGNQSPVTSNFFGGVFVAATNLINSETRPDIISASYGYGEFLTDKASKTAIDLMWAQADAEGISVFVSTGDSGSNPSFNGSVINGSAGNSAVDANSLATSAHVTAVGGTDLADVLDGTTSQYFAAVPSVVGGSALSYVPEIPWNQSCGNGVAAKVSGFGSAVAFCQALKYSPNGFSATSEAGSGGPSSVDAKPTWQRQVYNAASDQSRDLPDVSLFAGSYGQFTYVIICTEYSPCSHDFNFVQVSGGTSLSSPMFAGIQALMDQGLHARGLPLDQGNAAPTLYALAAAEYGGPNGTAPASLAACSADNGASGTSNCIFHNVTRGANSTQCFQPAGGKFTTANCYYYGTDPGGDSQYGLTTTDVAPTAYGVSNKAFAARPGWSFASGLGSVNATNLLIAWRAFDNAPPAKTSATH